MIKTVKKTEEKHPDWAKAKPRKEKVKGKIYNAQVRVTKRKQ